jgi:hypothetical protein
VASWSVFQRRKKKGEEKKKKWWTWLKFISILKSSKFDPSGADDWLRSDFQMVEVHLPSFRIFEQVEVGFRWSSYFQIRVQKEKR